MEAGCRDRDIDRGWAWVVMGATYLGQMMFATSYFMVGVVYVELLEHYQDDEVKTSLVGTLNMAIYALLAPFASAVASRYTCRTSIMIGSLLMATSGVLSSFMDSVGMLILTYGVFGGIGNTLVGIPLGVILGYYFEKRRHFVISLAAAVFGAGMFLSTPLALTIFTEYGIKGGFMILGGFNLHMCVIGMICKPSSLELKIQQHKSTHRAYIQSTERINGVGDILKKYVTKLNNLFHIEMMTDFKFVMFLLSTFTWNFMLAICQMHLPNYMLLRGSGPREVTAIMTLFGACNTIGRFLGAFSVNNSRIDSLLLHVIFLAISGILVLTFPLYGYLTGATYFFAVAIGLLTGGPNGIMASIALSILGLQKLAAAHGLEYFFCGLGFGGGPPIASALYRHSGSYSTSFIVAGSSVLLGAALASLAYLRSRRIEDQGNIVLEQQTDATKDGTSQLSEQNKRNHLDDPLLSTCANKTGVHALTNGLRPDLEDIITLAGSSHSITI